VNNSESSSAGDCANLTSPKVHDCHDQHVASAEGNTEEKPSLSSPEDAEELSARDNRAHFAASRADTIAEGAFDISYQPATCDDQDFNTKDYERLKISQLLTVKAPNPPQSQVGPRA